MKHVLIASSNPGKLRDFAAVAARHGVEVALLPHFSSLPECIEDGATFEQNARKKAEHYSLHAPGEVVLADDSGIEIDALGGAPGVRSARYAASTEHGNSDDAANNALVLDRMKDVPDEKRTGRFVCAIAIARDGKSIATFRGHAEGTILRELRGSGGFGYDPMFYFPALAKTFAQLTPAEKAQVSHRGQAFDRFLEWCDRQDNI
ncbi:MAG TPA: RdgB/HAM1 family non-canonical purine NTP pyrophosphatase [Terriglobales bacterium]|nr:RdgB/HAM1 family non-canonical purine NTP pyrophosphatase [Terriglobales bacterium]